MENVHSAVYLPVTEGMWKQHELWDGTYTFDDWADAIEIIQVKKENENRLREYAQIENKR